MTTFLLILLTILSSGAAGYVYAWLTGEEASDEFSDPTADARQLWSDISADVQRAEEQIQRLSRPAPGRRPQP